jgi:hypothetical protein
VRARVINEMIAAARRTIREYGTREGSHRPHHQRDVWLGEWSRDEAVAVLKLITQGRGAGSGTPGQIPPRSLAEGATPVVHLVRTAA